MKKFSWRQVIGYGLVVLLVAGLLWYQLGTLVAGFSVPELVARSEVSSFHKLLANPLFLPHKILQYGLIRLGYTGAFWMRSVSALFGLAIIVVFYDIIRSWYSRRIALMGTWLLMTAAWFLHFARLGTPDILFATSIGLLWVGMRLRSVNAPRIRTVLASIIVLLTCLYVPGLAWAVIPMLVWQRKLIWKEFSKIPKALAAFVGLGIIVSLSPLVYGFINTPSLVRSWLYIPNSINPSDWLANLWQLPIWLSLRGPTAPVYWLGHVPLLDVFSIVMLVLGAFVLNYYRLLDRVRAIMAIIALSLVLAIFNGWLALTIALPLLYVVIAAGVALFLQQWFTVFPRNPLARGVGISLVTFVIVLAGFYNIRHYFVAWPRNSETKQIFTLPG